MAHPASEAGFPPGTSPNRRPGQAPLGARSGTPTPRQKSVTGTLTNNPAQHHGRWLWVPAFAGTTRGAIAGAPCSFPGGNNSTILPPGFKGLTLPMPSRSTGAHPPGHVKPQLNQCGEFDVPIGGRGKFVIGTSNSKPHWWSGSDIRYLPSRELVKRECQIQNSTRI
jgi:hypothetical protein